MASAKGVRRAHRRASRREYYAANREKARAYARQYHAANPEKRRATYLRRYHGMPPEGWAALWDAQQGLCYLCEEPMASDDAKVEHDHSCCPPQRSCRACRRGLAHNLCNQLIGLAGDDPGKLARIAKNLRVAKRGAAERIAAKPGQLAMFGRDAS